MIAIYLLPYPLRGIRAPYLWVFYKWMTVLRERALFIVGNDYLRNPESFAAEQRWELAGISQTIYGYTPPTAERLAEHDFRLLPDDLYGSLLSACRGNPVELFRRMLTERLPALEEAISAALSGSGGEAQPVEAILTWCNCPSLSAVAAARNIRVVHLEVGPLRAPLYRPTAYLDFSGVNANTEAEPRYSRLPPVDAAICADRLRRFFLSGVLPPKDPIGRIGLALQVEDDSNLVAFGNGFDNQAAAVYVRLTHGGEGPIAIRAHPGSLFKIRGASWFETDESYDSMEFIQRCKRIVNVNSSLGLEAVLLGTPVTVLGECSYKFILDVADEKERLARLAFYLFAYLIPEALQFDLDYLRFRLSDPGEMGIVDRHLRHYLGEPWTSNAAGRQSIWALIDAALRTPG